MGSLKRFKPGVDKRVHLLLTAILWTVVGISLMMRGGGWLLGNGQIWLFMPALLLGTGKSLLILDKAAEKGIDRILHFADNTCLGAVYSLQTWLLVLVMMGTGFLLRQSSLPRLLLGAVYVAIGWALLFSSRKAWWVWSRGRG